MAISLVPCDDATPLLAALPQIYAPRTFQGRCPADPEVELKPIPGSTRKESRPPAVARSPVSSPGRPAIVTTLTLISPAVPFASLLLIISLSVSKYLDITCQHLVLHHCRLQVLRRLSLLSLS